MDAVAASAVGAEVACKRATPLPPHLLRRLFAELPADDAVVVGAAVSEYTSVVYLGASELHVAKPDPLTLAGEGVGRRLLAVNGADRGHDLRVRERANLGLERQPVAGQLVDVQVAVGGAPRGLRFQRRHIRANRGAAT